MTNRIFRVDYSRLSRENAALKAELEKLEEEKECYFKPARLAALKGDMEITS